MPRGCVAFAHHGWPGVACAAPSCLPVTNYMEKCTRVGLFAGQSTCVASARLFVVLQTEAGLDVFSQVGRSIPIGLAYLPLGQSPHRPNGLV